MPRWDLISAPGGTDAVVTLGCVQIILKIIPTSLITPWLILSSVVYIFCLFVLFLILKVKNVFLAAGDCIHTSYTAVNSHAIVSCM